MLRCRFRKVTKHKPIRKQVRALRHDAYPRITKVRDIINSVMPNHHQNELLIIKLQKKYEHVSFSSLKTCVNIASAITKGVPSYQKYFSGYQSRKSFISKIIYGSSESPVPNYLTDAEKSHQVYCILEASQQAHKDNHETIINLLEEIRKLESDYQANTDFVFGEKLTMCERIAEYLVSNLPIITPALQPGSSPHYYSTHSLAKDVLLIGVYIVCGIFVLWAMISVPFIYHLVCIWPFR